MADGNGSYRVSFWVMTTIIIIVIAGGIVPAIVNNDRLRASEDQRIEAKIDLFKDCVHNIDLRLARMEAKLDAVIVKK